MRSTSRRDMFGSAVPKAMWRNGGSGSPSATRFRTNHKDDSTQSTARHVTMRRQLTRRHPTRIIAKPNSAATTTYVGFIPARNAVQRAVTEQQAGRRSTDEQDDRCGGGRKEHAGRRVRHSGIDPSKKYCRHYETQRNDGVYGARRNLRHSRARSLGWFVDGRHHAVDAKHGQCAGHPTQKRYVSPKVQHEHPRIEHFLVERVVTESACGDRQRCGPRGTTRTHTQGGIEPHHRNSRESMHASTARA